MGIGKYILHFAPGFHRQRAIRTGLPFDYHEAPVKGSLRCGLRRALRYAPGLRFSFPKSTLPLHQALKFMKAA